MKEQTGFRPWVKVLIFWVIFMLLYVLNKLAPFFPFTLISGINESNFQHYKATFFSYLILSLVEFLVFQKKIKDRSAFWFSRLLTSVFAPWITFLIWYLGPAIFGRLPNAVLEIVYGNVMTIITGIFAIQLEYGFSQIKFEKPIRMVILTLVVVSVLIYTVFTFKLPWADVFTEPNWKETSLLLWRLYV